jgi:hypothetical protein
MASQTQLTARSAQVPRTGAPLSPARRARLRRRNVWIYAFLMPTFVLYGLYTIHPMIASYWYSLVERNGFSSEMRFVGISNYQAVLSDPMFWSSVRITVAFMLVVAAGSLRSRVVVDDGFRILVDDEGDGLVGVAGVVRAMLEWSASRRRLIIRLRQVARTWGADPVLAW